MPVINRIAEFHAEMTEWRHDIHAHPETAFEEERTAEVVAKRLEGFGGIEIHRGLAKTGVVGTLKMGSGKRAIGLRADMDALHIHEANSFGHASQNPGRMHACGHDGHTTMLLGAAKYLAETKNFDGTVHFIFQPAEENEGGGRVMIEDGLFEKFPVEAVFGLHNWPGMDAGTFAVMPGPMMASFDIFEITMTGKGCHAAMPNMGVDPIVASAQLVTALQTIASRSTHPLEAAVVSVTQIHAGDTWNVIPNSVVLRGTTRSFKPEIQDLIEQRMRAISAGIAEAAGCTVEVRYERRYPPTVNSATEAVLAADIMAEIVGDKNVHRQVTPTMGGEDFAFMLQAKPGAYGWIGNGPTECGCLLHNPNYDFNDQILPIGASYWARLVETYLPKAA